MRTFIIAIVLTVCLMGCDLLTPDKEVCYNRNWRPNLPHGEPDSETWYSGYGQTKCYYIYNCINGKYYMYEFTKVGDDKWENGWCWEQTGLYTSMGECK